MPNNSSFPFEILTPCSIQADDSINDLEHHVAQLLGHEAALFCASGTMTNQLGLRTLLTQPPHSVLCDARSHIYNYECGGLGMYIQARIG